MKTVMVMGAGNMAHALVQGWSHASLPVSLLVLARSKSYQDKGWQTRWPVEVTHEPARISSVDTVILAVKPKDSAAALEQIRLYARPHTIVVSVMAGIPLAALEAALPDMRIVRAMPNIGSAVGSLSLIHI